MIMVWLKTRTPARNERNHSHSMTISMIALALVVVSILALIDGSIIVASSCALLIICIVSYWRIVVLMQRAELLKRLSRKLARRLRTVRQSERNRTARELHDGVCQLLIAARHSLEFAAEHRTCSSEFDALFSRGMKQLDDAIVETRRVSHDLKSVLLSEHGFTDALSYLGNEFAGRTRVCTNVKVADTALDRTLPACAKAALLRITQEALANVQKHSGATKVELALENCRDHVQLRISDNGCGFGARATASPSGIGLDNMRERAAELGGTLSLRSANSQTEVIACLPLAQRPLRSSAS
jgi:two-component system NarL family sensor kinase